MTADKNSAENTEETPEIIEDAVELLAAEPSDDALGDIESDHPAPVEPTPEISPTPPAPRRAGIFGPLLGGVLAAVIGFVGAQYLGPVDLPFLPNRVNSELAGKLAAQDTRLTEMSQQLAALANAPQDDSATADAVAALGAQVVDGDDRLTAQLNGLSKASADISTALAALDTRVVTLEKRPVAETPDLSGAVSAYENELSGLRTQIEQLQLDAEQAANDFADRADQAASQVQAANENAAKLESRAGLMQVQAALESGTAFETALASITTTDIPDALANAAVAGVPTQQQLVDGFAEPARAALATSRRVLAGGNAANRFGAFLQTQVGARSTVPRDSDSPDGILSRAEGALRDGDVQAALAALNDLPAEGLAEMQGWRDMAQNRNDALAAAQQLAADLAQK